MSAEAGEGTKRRAGRAFRAYWALAALVAGLALGALSGGLSADVRASVLAITGFVGTLWLNALKMTVIPLVVALLVTGIAKSAEVARAGRIGARSVMWIVAVCTASAAFGAVMIVLLTGLFPLPRETAERLGAALSGVEQQASPPPIGEFLQGVIPENIFAAASNGDILPLVVFAVLFALALTRIGAEGRKLVRGLFDAVADALLVIIGWVLWLAPIGVFALAFTVGHAAGGSAFAGFGHYVVIISAIGVLVTFVGYPIGILAGKIRPGEFVKCLIPSQAVAISTRSSLASLPAMLASVRAMGVREQVADVTLPICVALFRATGPAMNTAVAFYVAHWLGYQPTLAQMIAATAVGAVMSYAAVSLPGEISFISSIAPIAMALGAPIAPLALLVAVEMVPDIFRTVGNVTLDVAVTTAVDRSSQSLDDN